MGRSSYKGNLRAQTKGAFGSQTVKNMIADKTATEVKKSKKRKQKKRAHKLYGTQKEIPTEVIGLLAGVGK